MVNKAENPWPLGRTIVSARAITDEEMKAEAWEPRYGMSCTVLVLDDGSLLYPSQDPEGNGPGCLFGKDPDGAAVSL